MSVTVEMGQLMPAVGSAGTVGKVREQQACCSLNLRVKCDISAHKACRGQYQGKQKVQSPQHGPQGWWDWP